MSKQVSFSARPPSLEKQAAIDAFVNDPKSKPGEPVKRFTFEVPQSLHKRIKMTCASQDRQMAEVVRDEYATGVDQVFVNGRQVLKGGEPTGVAAGRFVKGPGAGKCPA